MNLSKFITMVTLVLPLICFAQGKSSYIYQVPFYNVEILPGSKIYANYNFMSHQQKLVCSTNSMVSSYIEWNYKSAPYGASLPSGGTITLKDDLYVDGYWADPQGMLIVFNANAFRPSLVVTCEYQNLYN